MNRPTKPFLSVLLLATKGVGTSAFVEPSFKAAGSSTILASRRLSTTTTTKTQLFAQHDWKLFVDLQCPFAKKAWQRFPELREKFGDEYDMSIHLTSLAFHPQAFVGQQAAHLIERERDAAAKQAFIDASFERQDRYKNDTLGDYKKSDVDQVFADIAQEAGVFDDSFTREFFLEHLHDWDEVIKPSYGEVKAALNYGVFGTPKHVIDDKLVLDTESAWGPEEWEDKLRSL